MELSQEHTAEEDVAALESWSNTRYNGPSDAIPGEIKLLINFHADEINRELARCELSPRVDHYSMESWPGPALDKIDDVQLFCQEITYKKQS